MPRGLPGRRRLSAAPPHGRGPAAPRRSGRNAIFCNQRHNGSSFLRASEKSVRGAAPLRPHSGRVEAETEFNYVRLSRDAQHNKHLIVVPRRGPGSLGLCGRWRGAGGLREREACTECWPTRRRRLG